MEHNRLKQRIMRRVYGIWLLRNIVPFVAVELGVLLISISVIANQVFVMKVVENMLLVSVGNPMKIVSYLVSAFFATSITTQMVAALTGVGALFLIRELYRSTASYALLKARSVASV